VVLLILSYCIILGSSWHQFPSSPIQNQPWGMGFINSQDGGPPFLFTVYQINGGSLLQFSNWDDIMQQFVNVKNVTVPVTVEDSYFLSEFDSPTQSPLLVFLNGFNNGVGYIDLWTGQVSNLLTSTNIFMDTYGFLYSPMDKALLFNGIFDLTHEMIYMWNMLSLELLDSAPLPKSSSGYDDMYDVPFWTTVGNNIWFSKLNGQPVESTDVYVWNSPLIHDSIIVPPSYSANFPQLDLRRGFALPGNTLFAFGLINGTGCHSGVNIAIKDNQPIATVSPCIITDQIYSPIYGLVDDTSLAFVISSTTNSVVYIYDRNDPNTAAKMYNMNPSIEPLIPINYAVVPASVKPWVPFDVVLALYYTDGVSFTYEVIPLSLQD